MPGRVEPQWAQADRVVARHGHLAARAQYQTGMRWPHHSWRRDAPIADVLQPVVVDLGEALGHDADVAASDRLQGRLGQRLHPHEPLGGDHRLDDLAAALAARHLHGVRLGLDRQAGRLHVGPQALAALEAVQAGVWAGVLVHRGVGVEHVDDRQAVPLADLVVGRVVAGRDLERAGAELPIDVGVMDHRDRAVEDRHQAGLADQMPVALVVRVHGHGGVAQDGLRARRRHRDELVASRRSGT